ncbi:MAG: hypothetical protein JXA52_08355 [Planctomycetes bacterium]|nr:hypothetical protein [Planctomycetota bacterium]
MQEMISQVIGSLPGGYTPKQNRGRHKQPRYHWEHHEHARVLASGDIVELSSSAPQAFTSEELATVFSLSDRLSQGEEVATEEILQLQTERTLFAVLAMELMKPESTAAKFLWPTGIKNCTTQEFESAYQRLVQHVSRESMTITEQIELRRRALVEAYRSLDFELLAD